jgi:hypothetical protein
MSVVTEILGLRQNQFSITLGLQHLSENAERVSSDNLG